MLKLISLLQSGVLRATVTANLMFQSDAAVDSSNNVYVADQDNNRIQKFDSSGKFITKWGSYGNGDGQFHNPDGIEVDSSGNVYVSDTDNNRIQKFDSNGTFITQWGSGSSDGQFITNCCYRFL